MLSSLQACELLTTGRAGFLVCFLLDGKKPFFTKGGQEHPS
jgi:hypothetical protein